MSSSAKATTTVSTTKAATVSTPAAFPASAGTAHPAPFAGGMFTSGSTMIFEGTVRICLPLMGLAVVGFLGPVSQIPLDSRKLGRLGRLG